MEYPTDNEFSVDRWKLGKALFYDKRMSIDHSTSCATCHKVGLAFSDDRATTPGAFSRPGTRNAPTLTNVGYQPYFLKEGGVPTLEQQALVPIQESNEFDHNILVLAAQLDSISTYHDMAQKAYERPLDPFVITRALGVFQRTIISGQSAYDRFYYQGKETALTQLEKEGMNLFFGATTGCSNCHNGFNFTDYSVVNNGLYTSYDDIGKMRLTLDPEDEGKFKVPTLRNVGLTAPYMHDGSLPSLRAVIEHYEKGGVQHPNQSELIQPLSLSEQDKIALEAFLHTLTDHQLAHSTIFQP